MWSKIQRMFLSLAFSTVALTTQADPWFTGPIFAEQGRIVSKGHVVIQPYFFDIHSLGFFDSHGKVVKVPEFHTQNPVIALYFSMTDRIDGQILGSYNINSTLGRLFGHAGDTNLGLGLQVYQQKKQQLIPDIRLVLQEIFPTGLYDHFDPMTNGAELTGLGSFQTILGLRLQSLYEFKNHHYLRSRLNFNYYLTSPVKVTGFNAYGGGLNTKGTIHPSDHYLVDLSFEYTLTQNWVSVMEFLYLNGQKTSFQGRVGTTLNGDPATLLTGRSNQFSIAPAIEYNFTPNIGVIAGMWLTLSGKQTPDVISAVVSIVYYI